MTKMEIARTTINMVSQYFDLDVKVKLIPSHEVQPDYNAYCTEVCEGEYEINVNPNFVLNCEEEEWVQLIAHEMVHVKQHENDGLSLEVRAHYFRGTWYDPEDDYWFNPWEIEARGYEAAFWSMYANNWSKFV
jgi:hypothetical protein